MLKNRLRDELRPFRLKRHLGVVLPCGGVEQRHMGFASAYFNEDTGETFLFFSDAPLDWRTSCISVAVSSDGVSFKLLEEGKSLIKFGRKSLCPAVFRVENRLFMVFAFEEYPAHQRAIALAKADDLLGPYEVLGVLARPSALWEGTAIDIGPSVASVSEREFLVFYSNVSVLWRYLHAPLRVMRVKGSLSSHGLSMYRTFKGLYRSFKALPRSLILNRRRLGILRLRVTRTGHVFATRYERNPLNHLNGPLGSWCESLFCPGYMRLDGQHVLFPTAAIYSKGPPYRHFIGVFVSPSPFFEKAVEKYVLIDGLSEKEQIVSQKKSRPRIRGGLLLDTASPIVKKDELWLYYAVLGEQDGRLRTALSIFSLPEEII
mgnify:CR=1 FL=1